MSADIPVKLREIKIAGFRSIRLLRLPLDRVTVICGANGVGKTNIYNALRLLHAAAANSLGQMIAREGGMPSVLWAGARKKEPVRLSIAVADDDFQYALTCGLPKPSPISLFTLDPEVKEEELRLVDRDTLFMTRANGSVRIRDTDGRWQEQPPFPYQSESVLAEIRDLKQFPILAELRSRLLAWRFYHAFRTDPDSPIRQPAVAFRSPSLNHLGDNLAATLRTIIEIGDHQALQDTIERAFPGSELSLESPQAGWLSVGVKHAAFQRTFTSPELSDGTLKFLCLTAALLSPRPPALVVLNEPEGSLHEQLLEPLAELLKVASRSSQILLTTHSRALALACESACAASVVNLEKFQGETRVQDD